MIRRKKRQNEKETDGKLLHLFAHSVLIVEVPVIRISSHLFPDMFKICGLLEEERRFDAGYIGLEEKITSKNCSLFFIFSLSFPNISTFPTPTSTILPPPNPLSHTFSLFTSASLSIDIGTDNSSPTLPLTILT